MEEGYCGGSDLVSRGNFVILYSFRGILVIYNWIVNNPRCSGPPFSSFRYPNYFKKNLTNFLLYLVSGTIKLFMRIGLEECSTQSKFKGNPKDPKKGTNQSSNNNIIFPIFKKLSRFFNFLSREISMSLRRENDP